MRDKTSWKLLWKKKSGWKSGDDKGNWQIWQIMWRFAVMDVSTRKRKTCLALSGSQESSMEGDPPKTSTQKSILSVIINHDNQNHENYCWYDGIQEYAGMCFCQDDNKGYDDEKCWILIWCSKWWLRWWGWRWLQMWGQAVKVWVQIWAHHWRPSSTCRHNDQFSHIWKSTQKSYYLAFSTRRVNIEYWYTNYFDLVCVCEPCESLAQPNHFLWQPFGKSGTALENSILNLSMNTN